MQTVQVCGSFLQTTDEFVAICVDTTLWFNVTTTKNNMPNIVTSLLKVDKYGAFNG